MTFYKRYYNVFWKYDWNGKNDYQNRKRSGEKIKLLLQ